LAIAGIVLLYPRFGGHEKAHINNHWGSELVTRNGIVSALGQYQVDNGFYPKSLQDFFQKPSDATNWHGPYWDPPKWPVDPWGNKFFYEYPGKHNTRGYDLLSAGPDGKAGTGDDIGNWMN
jgi:general secretion pathway protein G